MLFLFKRLQYDVNVHICEKNMEKLIHTSRCPDAPSTFGHAGLTTYENTTPKVFIQTYVYLTMWKCFNAVDIMAQKFNYCRERTKISATRHLSFTRDAFEILYGVFMRSVSVVDNFRWMKSSLFKVNGETWDFQFININGNFISRHSFNFELIKI